MVLVIIGSWTIGDAVRSAASPSTSAYTIHGIGGVGWPGFSRSNINDSMSGRVLLHGHRIAATGESSTCSVMWAPSAAPSRRGARSPSRPVLRQVHRPGWTTCSARKAADGRLRVIGSRRLRHSTSCATFLPFLRTPAAHVRGFLLDLAGNSVRTTVDSAPPAVRRLRRSGNVTGTAIQGELTVASKARCVTCDDCFFRKTNLCALRLSEPCPTVPADAQGPDGAPAAAPPDRPRAGRRRLTASATPPPTATSTTSATRAIGRPRDPRWPAGRPGPAAGARTQASVLG